MSEMLLEDLVSAALEDGVARLVRNDALLLRDEGGPEAVHQARVATRRLRSDLRTFRGALDVGWTRQLRAELDWLGDVLGAARDADVLLARLTERGSAMPAAGAPGVDEVCSALAAHRAQAHAALREALRSERHRALIERLTESARTPALTDEAARPAGSAAVSIMRASWRALERRVDSLADAPADAELHAVRIRAKRCRYAAEACAPLLGKPARRLARAAASLQDVLGELNDAVVAERWLREWAAHAGSPPGAFAAGELAVLERAAASRARSRWPKAWRRVKDAAPAKR